MHHEHIIIGLIVLVGLAAKASSVTYIPERDNYPRECLSGPTFWCSSLKNAKSCKAVNHCIQTVWSRTVVLDDKDDVCHACKDMIQKVKSALLANSTSQDLRLVFETSCKLIPVKLVKEECLKIVDQFIPDILEMMAARMNPLNVCSSIGLCNSNWVDQILAEYSGARKEPSRSTNIEQCQYCRYAVDKVQTVSDTFVFGKILELCSQAGSFADTCVSLLMDHFDEQYKMFMDSLKGVDVCSQFHYCYAFEKSEKPKSEASSPAFIPNDDIQCEFCENMIKNLRDILVTNTTENEFKIVLQSLCKQSGTFEKQCLELVDQYHSSFYNFLVNGLNPKETCRLLTLCPNPGLSQLSKQPPLWIVSISFPSSQEEESEEVHIEKAADSEEDDRLNYAVVNQEGKHSEVDDDIDVVTLGDDSGTGSSSDEIALGKFLDTENVARDAKPEKTGAKAANTSFCLICEYAMNELDRRLSNASTEAEIRQTVDNLCAYLPNTVAEMCITFIDKYGDDVYQMLLQKLVPKAICLQIGLCLSSGPSDSIFIPYEDVEEVETVDTCDMCQIVVDYIDRELEDDTVEESLDRIVERACNLVPASSQTTCKAIVDTYGPYLISELGSVADKRKICEMFHLCKASDPKTNKRQLLGEEKCTWGPSHWCSSVENAKSCNALEHCQKKVWLKAEP